MIACKVLIHKAWHQKFEERVCLRFEAHIGVRCSGFYSRESFFIDFDVEWCGWADFGLNRIGCGYCIE